MADQPKDIYAPIPARVMADEKLTAEHFRVLMAVAAHDRFNRNGKGCCASHPRLAKLAKCHRKSLSRSLKVLAEWGYIAGLPSPFNKRQRAYRVVYSDADRAIMTNPIGINPATEADPIGNKDFHEPEQNQELPDDKRFSETVVEESSAQAASSCDDDLLGNEGSEPVGQRTNGQYLGQVQTWLKRHQPHLLSDTELAALTTVRDECLRIEDSAEAHHGGIGGWAQRLAVDIDILLDEPDDDAHNFEPFNPPPDLSVLAGLDLCPLLAGKPGRFTAVIGGRA